MADFKEIKYEPRQDWNQTSTGVGHQYRPGYYFPSSHFHVNGYFYNILCDFQPYYICQVKDKYAISPYDSNVYN